MSELMGDDINPLLNVHEKIGFNYCLLINLKLYKVTFWKYFALISIPLEKNGWLKGSVEDML